jgi:hypothetical protein
MDDQWPSGRPRGVVMDPITVIIRFQKVEPNAVQFCSQLLLSTILIKTVYPI